MLSSRPQHVLYTDKENAVSAAPSRKGAGLSVHGQANMLKTPGAKQQQQQQSHMRGAAKTVKATSSKQSLESTQLKDRKLGGPATIALEPGARVLGAKDGNNRALHGGRAGSDNGKGKGRAMDAVYDDCSLMPLKNAATVKKSTQEALKSSKKAAVNFATQPAPPPATTAKTPARQTARSRNPGEADDISAAFKTPRLEAASTSKRVSPPTSSLIPSFSAFKTPSPNQLLRRRKGGGSPVPFHFNPTSLRLDGSEDLEDAKPPKPTLLEELDAYHATIDETQEVDCATRQAVDPDDLPVDLPFEMPNYKEMDILGITFRATFPLPRYVDIEETTPISYDDSDMHARDYIYEKEWVHEPLFPISVNVKSQPKTASSHKREATGPAASQQSRILASHVKTASSDTIPTKGAGPSASSSTRKPSTLAVSRTSGLLKAASSRPRLPSKTPALPSKSPAFRLTASDLPEVVQFDIGDIDLLL